MIKPAGAYGNIALADDPFCSMGIAGIQVALIRRSDDDVSCIYHRPVGLTGKAVLIANPPDIRTRVRKNKYVWLESFDQFPDFIPTIIRSSVDSSFFPGATIIAGSSICSVEPYF